MGLEHPSRQSYQSVRLLPLHRSLLLFRSVRYFPFPLLIPSVLLRLLRRLIPSVLLLRILLFLWGRLRR